MMTLKQALTGQEIPDEIRRNLVLLNLEYWGFDEAWHCGQMVVQHDVAADVQEIFGEIAVARFPIQKMVPVVVYNWLDDASMADNNSSSFNYRLALGKPRLSYHAYGRAIDINPLQNPYIKGDLVLPPGAVYNRDTRGTLLADGPVVVAFEKRGWAWGGRWTQLRDWHHFEKADAEIEAAALRQAGALQS